MIIKKLASYFLSLVCILCSMIGVFNTKVHAETEYEAHVAIFCDNIELAEQYVQLLHEYEYDGIRDTPKERGSGKSTEKTVIRDYGGVYNVYFHIIPSYMALHPNRELNDLIKCCTGAVILYNVLDPALQTIIESNRFYEEDVKPLLEIDTPLNNCIKYLQSFGRYGWHNALEFIMYNSEGLADEDREERLSQLMEYTLAVEHFYVDGDNKWDRNHPVWDNPGSINHVLGWVTGQVFRSIFDEKTLTGAPGLLAKKKLNSPVLTGQPTASEEMSLMDHIKNIPQNIPQSCVVL